MKSRCKPVLWLIIRLILTNWMMPCVRYHYSQILRTFNGSLSSLHKRCYSLSIIHIAEYIGND
ncbi:hypothetical protein O6H91_01G122500 [Diphasiastrum complanatum]|uniref:Uncharacterized protein n=1 Tax=Diphasiastrum complanatum TaxID=34168 RepID=A0ACC2EVI1_DIPCM|nr:hypothetical protein O6H91_01G122500 [Diphasiastrum complanatum]